MFVRVNGWPISIRDRGATENVVALGELGEDTFDGRPRRHRRGLVREVDLNALYLSPENADTLSALLEGKAHRFGFDNGDAFSDSGIGPEFGGAYSVPQRTFGVSASGTHGSHYLSVTTSITWDLGLPEDSWTVMCFNSVASYSGTIFPAHRVVRSDGAKWFNGVRNDAMGSTYLLVAGGAVQLTTGSYDEVVVFPFKASQAFIESFYRWTAALHVDIPLGASLNLIDRSVNSDAPSSVSASSAKEGPFGTAIVLAADSDGVVWSSKTRGYVYESTEASWEIWIKPTDATPNADGYVVRRIDVGETAGWTMAINNVSPAVGFNVFFTIITGGGSCSSSSSARAPLDEWSHLVATWDETSGVVRLYLNGDDVTVVGTTDPGGLAQDESGEPFVIGNRAALDNAMIGSLSGYRQYRVKLTAEEVRERYLAGVHGRFHPGGAEAFSASPEVNLAGDLTGWRSVPVLAEVNDEPVLPMRLKATAGLSFDGSTTYDDTTTIFNGPEAWRSNVRTLSATARERRISEPPFNFSPLVLWRLTEIESTALGFNDVTRRGMTGSQIGAPYSYERGPFGFGRAQVFDGTTTEYITLTDTLTLLMQGKRALTGLAWVKVNPGNAANRTLFASANLGGQNKFTFGISAASVVRTLVRPTATDTNYTRTGVLSINDGAWHLIGVVANIAGGAVVTFVDGAGIDGGEYLPGAAAPFTATEFDGSANAGQQRIGRAPAALEGWFGSIACVALFDGALSATQVHQIYKAGRRGLLLGRQR